VKIIALVLAVCLAVPALAQARAQRDWYAGIKLGLVAPGELTVENGTSEDFDTDWAPNLGLFADFRIGQKLLIGPYLDYGLWTIEADEDYDADRIDIGAAFKGDFRFQQFRIRPAAGMAIGQMKFEEDAYEDDFEILSLNGWVEFHYPFQPRVNLLGELGFTTIVKGENRDYDINHGPILFARFGVAFH
jgi:hypothetical protein